MGRAILPLWLVGLLLTSCNHSTSPSSSSTNTNSLNLGLCRGCSAPAGTQKPKVGMWYFDGWADTSTSNKHLYPPSELLQTVWSGREPTTGWYDNAQSTIETFSNWGQQAGISFWTFEWFPGGSTPSSNGMNTALTNYLASTTAQQNMQFAVAYMNGFATDPVTPANWQTYCNSLVAYFTNPSYVRVNGKAIFFIFNPDNLNTVFSGAGGLSAAVNTLNATAQNAGVQLTIISLNGMPSATVASAGITTYSYYSNVPNPGSVTLGTVASPAQNPYSVLVSAAQSIWSQNEALSSSKGGTYIPVVTTGWDNRPWGNYESQLIASEAYISRDPTSVANLYAQAASWAWSHASHNPNPSQPIVMIEAWNELGEGAYMVPTQGDGTTYLAALAAQIPQ